MAKATKRTTYSYWFGSDCLGNTPHAFTMEGICIQDIYETPGRRFYNQRTNERGDVMRCADGELHFFTEAEWKE